MADERPQEHWLDAIAEYTVHAPNCPFYEDGNCECAVEELRATLRRVLVPSNLRAATSEGKDVVVIGLERILKAVDVPDTLLSGTRSVLRRAIARLRAGTGDTPRFKRTIVCAACAMEDDDPLVCDTPGCDGIGVYARRAPHAGGGGGAVSALAEKAMHAVAEYERWHAEVERLGAEIGACECPHEVPSEPDPWGQGMMPGWASCFRSTKERLEENPGGNMGGPYAVTLGRIAADPEVVACPACSRLCALIAERKAARQQRGIAKRRVRHVGKLVRAARTQEESKP